MSQLTCAEVRESVPELALDILEPGERAAVAAHLAHCPACQGEVDAMVAVGARLLDLVPGTEPPLGFDRRVLAKIREGELDGEIKPGWAGRDRKGRRGAGRRPLAAGRPPHLFAGLAAAAAVVALVFGSLGWFAGRTSSHHGTHVMLTADFHQGTRDIGEIYTYGGSPPWMSMTVHGATGAEKVTCELVWNDGTVTRLGTFDLVSGSGSWSAPDKAGVTGVTGAQLVGPDGQVIATATFN